MLSVSLGPLAMPIGVVLTALALVVATAVGRMTGRDKNEGIGYVLIDMLLAALLAARIGFIALWFETYRAAPWSMLDIRDGGFNPWAGLSAALLVALVYGARRAALRKPLALGLAAGALCWGALFGAIALMNNASLPKTPLRTLAGAPADLAKLAAGKPIVLNLWATWCPPCRRELPALAEAQKKETWAYFAFADQGEDPVTVQRFLAAAGLDLSNVLLDPGAGISREISSAGLPTTLFYGADGRLVDTHVGQLTAGSLAAKLERLRPPH